MKPSNELRTGVLPVIEDDPTAPIDQFRYQWAFLSNFYPCAVFYGLDRYYTVEAAYQAAKTKVPLQRAAIRDAAGPHLAKRLGQRVTLRPDWEQIKREVMSDLLWQKFTRHDLRDLLLSTGERELIEGNDWRDHYWGICGGVGENYLGRLLMAIREVLRLTVFKVDAGTSDKRGA